MTLYFEILVASYVSPSSKLCWPHSSALRDGFMGNEKTYKKLKNVRYGNREEKDLGPQRRQAKKKC
jgi:hypothetical protein